MAVPDLRTVVLEKIEEFEAVVGAGVCFGAVEITEGVEGSVVREVDGVCRRWILGEAWVLHHSTVEYEFQHQWVGSVPTVGPVVGFLTETVVREARAQVL